MERGVGVRGSEVTCGAMCSPVVPEWIPRGGAAPAPRGRLAAGVPETHLRFPTPFAGANRIRFEGLRRTALSALERSPVVGRLHHIPAATRVAADPSDVASSGRRSSGKDRHGDGQAVAWKIMGTGGAILAGIIATKVIDAIWARAGQDEINPKNPHAPLAKAVAYAADHRPRRGRRADDRDPQGRLVLREVVGPPARRTSATTPSDPLPPPPERQPQGRSSARASGIPGR